MISKSSNLILKDGNFYDVSINKIIQSNVNIVCGIVDIKSNIIYGFNKKKYPKKKCIIDNEFIKQYTLIPIKQHIFNKNIYITIDYSNNKSLSTIIGTIDNIDSEKKYIKLKCISNWNLYKKYNIFNKNNHHRIDFTHKQIFSIDPLHSKDIDDAIHIEQIDNNMYEIGIHIADVSSFIECNSDLDKELIKRGKSIYLQDETIHMLPYDIMIELSLIENKIRNAFSILFKINNNGHILDYTFYKSIIKNKKQMSYDDAQKIINDKSNDNLNNLYNIGNKIYDILNIKYDKYDVHKMIEIYMIITNIKVAETIKKYNSDITIVRTQHENIIKNTFNNDILQDISYKYYLLYNKNKANYTIGIDDIGHYDLNCKYYTHFTSPLRRYIDIINHRILNNIINNENEIYTKDYITVCIEYYNRLYKWYQYQERYYNNINRIYEIYEKENNKQVNGKIIGFMETEKVYIIVYIPYLNNIYYIILLSEYIKKVINYEITSDYFKQISDDKIFELHLFDEIIIEICISIMSKKKINIKLINPNPYTMFTNIICDNNEHVDDNYELII